MEDTFKPLNIQITEEMVQWNFDKIDVDHSGRISFDEYMKFIKKYNSWLIKNIYSSNKTKDQSILITWLLLGISSLP